MLFAVDTEFTNLGQDADLISIGISSGGELFYAEITDYDKNKCSEFVKANVIPNLYLHDLKRGELYSGFLTDGSEISIIKGTKKEVGQYLKDFISDLNASGSKVTFVSDVCHYDATLLFELLKDEKTEELLEFINPMMIDISTLLFEKYLFENGFSDALTKAFDVSRENIVLDDYEKDIVKKLDLKHNALYDAIIIELLTDRLVFNEHSHFEGFEELDEILRNYC